jgi:hypothetical protein
VEFSEAGTGQWPNPRIGGGEEEENEELLNFKAGGTYRYHCALKV